MARALEAFRFGARSGVAGAAALFLDFAAAFLPFFWARPAAASRPSSSASAARRLVAETLARKASSRAFCAARPSAARRVYSARSSAPRAFHRAAASRATPAALPLRLGRSRRIASRASARKRKYDEGARLRGWTPARSPSTIPAARGAPKPPRLGGARAAHASSGAFTCGASTRPAGSRAHRLPSGPLGRRTGRGAAPPKNAPKAAAGSPSPPAIARPAPPRPRRPPPRGGPFVPPARPLREAEVAGSHFFARENPPKISPFSCGGQGGDSL